MLALTGLGLSSEEAVNSLTHPLLSVTQHGVVNLDGLFDASDRAEEGGVIGWLNDIAQDARCVFKIHFGSPIPDHLL